jgi:pimeloyl-ACP methyl ester carboxylesterase
MEQVIDADLLRIPVGPGSVHVERYGRGGEPVVLLHGFGTSSFLWRNIAPTLTLSGLTAFAVDLLGYGESDRPMDADYSIGAQAEYLDRALAGLQLPRATIVGLGIGGGVAMRLACTRPARVGRLGLINSVAFDECPGRDVRSIQLGTARFALRVSQGVLGAAPLLKRVLEEGVARPEAMPSRLVARYLAPYAGADGVMHLLALARALRAVDVESLPLARLEIPTLIIWGEAEPWLDGGLPERLQRAIPGSRLVRMAQVGHLVPEDSPEVLAQLLAEHARGTGHDAMREPHND